MLTPVAPNYVVKKAPGSFAAKPPRERGGWVVFYEGGGAASDLAVLAYASGLYTKNIVRAVLAIHFWAVCIF